MWLFCAIDILGWPWLRFGTPHLNECGCDKVGIIFNAHLAFFFLMHTHTHTHYSCIALCVLYTHLHRCMCIYCIIFTCSKIGVLNSWQPEFCSYLSRVVQMWSEVWGKEELGFEGTWLPGIVPQCPVALRVVLLSPPRTPWHQDALFFLLGFRQEGGICPANVYWIKL